MQFWAVILILYLVGAFALRDDFGQLFLQADGAWWAALLVVGLIVIAFSTAIKNLFSFLTEERNTTLFALAALFCIGGIEYVNSAQSRPPAPETAALALTSTETILNRSWDGHFRAITQINGTDIGLLIDTGASLVLLRHDDALRIGLPLTELDYSTPLTTANGKSYVAPIILETLRIGDVVATNVKAAVAREGALHSSLLGMSFLEKIDETVIQRNRMILRH